MVPAVKLLPFALLSFVVVGCNSEPSRYAASGTVTMDGAPAAYVVIKFNAIEKDSPYSGIGTSDPKGEFKIGEDGKDTGFPAGEYKVTFSQTTVKGKPTLAGSGGKAAEKDPTEKEAVPADFRDPEKTPVTAKITSGTNKFTFDIKSK